MPERAWLSGSVSGQVYQGNETMSMNFHKTIIFASLALCSVGSVFAGQTVVYKGTGSYVATKALMPLGSGGAAVHMSNKIIATIEPSEVGFMHGTCAGMGHISDVGDDSMQAYCTFEEKRGDIFDIKATGVKGMATRQTAKRQRQSFEDSELANHTDRITGAARLEATRGTE